MGPGFRTSKYDENEIISGGRAMSRLAVRPRPLVVPAYCKGCGRCIGACIKNCFAPGSEIDPVTGLVPTALDLTNCNGCALCVDACPEPHGLHLQGDDAFELMGPGLGPGPQPVDFPVPE